MSRSQVLVCAPSNVAVDQLAEKINQTGLKVVRVSARTRESLTSSADFLSLHTLVYELAKQSRNDLYKLTMLREMQGQLESKDDQRYRKLREQAEMAILKNADVICCTCVGAGDARLAHFRFRHVLIDEATQACEPELLIPLTKGAKQVVLVGDHCQLGPVVMHRAAGEAGLSRSLFERLIQLGNRPVRLQVQYRMHPSLSEFPSNTFYDGFLQNGVSAAERTPKPNILPFPTLSKPMMFWHMNCTEELAGNGVTYLNRAEAQAVEQLLRRAILESGVEASRIGVITPYEGQRSYLMHLLQTGPLSPHIDDLEVSSVDGFQGREKDFIIFTCVRSNENNSVGFISDPRRLNVSLTRAKFGLVIVGNVNVLAKNPLWNSLLQHFQQNHLIVSGTVSSLTEFDVKLEAPRKYRNPRNVMVPVTAASASGVFTSAAATSTDSNQIGMPQTSPTSAEQLAALQREGYTRQQPQQMLQPMTPAAFFFSDYATSAADSQLLAAYSAANVAAFAHPGMIAPQASNLDQYTGKRRYAQTQSQQDYNTQSQLSQLSQMSELDDLSQLSLGASQED